MASSEIVDMIIEMTAGFVEYMLPIMAVIAGINFIFTLLVFWTIGFARRSFRD